jgi:hypothetical protein
MAKQLRNSEIEEDLEYIPLDDDEVWTSYDLGCSAALLTAGFELLTLDRTNQHKVKFVFKREANIEKVADSFWSNNLEQKTRSYWDNIKTLKNRLYSGD